eukprot:5221579-Amphidinium_carterae.1
MFAPEPGSQVRIARNGKLKPQSSNKYEMDRVPERVSSSPMIAQRFSPPCTNLTGKMRSKAGTIEQSGCWPVIAPTQLHKKFSATIQVFGLPKLVHQAREIIEPLPARFNLGKGIEPGAGGGGAFFKLVMHALFWTWPRTPKSTVSSRACIQTNPAAVAMSPRGCWPARHPRVSGLPVQSKAVV